MDWNKVSEFNDLITYEKKKEDLLIRIEARLEEENQWNIFKNYIFEGNNFLEEYHASTREDVLTLVHSLIKEKDLTKEQIMEIKKQQSKKLNVEIKRSYKEIDTEKWFFNINKDIKKNFFVIYYGREIEIDVVMHETYKPYEERITNEIVDVLGLKKYGDEIKLDLYYYNNKNSRKKESDENAKIAQALSIGLQMDEE